VVVAGCSGDDGEATTTVGLDGSVTSLAPPGGGDGGAGGSTTTVAGGGATSTTRAEGAAAVPEFEILERQSGESGDTLVVLLDPTSYTSLTDIDLQNVLAEVVEDFPPVAAVHVIDDERAAPLIGKEQLTPEEQQLLENFYLVKLEDGFRITFVGPFADVAPTVLGS